MSRHDKFLAISGIVDSRCPDPGPRQHRPDQEQNPDLPDPPGRREERPGRPQERPLHHFPSWVESLWNLLLQHGATEMLEEGPIVYLDSFYISHLHCRKQETNRPLRLDQHYEDWATQIMEVWHDHFDRNSAFEVFLVDPDPPAPITRGTVGTVLISQHPDGRQVAVMTTIANDDIRGPWIKEIAHSFEWMTPHRHVLHQAGVLANCLEMQRQGLGRCEIRLGDFTFPHERPLRLHDGLGLVIDIPMIVTDEIWSSMILPRLQEATRSGPSQTSTVTATEQVPDHTSFMARRPQPRQTRTSTDSTSSSSASTSRSAEPSSQDPQDWRRTAIFTTDGQAQSALLPWHDSTELYARVATAFGVTRGEILQLYQVLERPQDLEQIQVHCMLLQRREEPQPVHILQFILLDLEITEENNILPGIFTRKAAWMPHVITRQSILRILNLESLQQQQPERCRIWHNNQIIDQDRSSPLTFVDGDYLAIYIGDEDKQFSCTSNGDVVSFQQHPILMKMRVSEAHRKSHTALDLCPRPPGRVIRRRRQAQDHDGDDDTEQQAWRDLWTRTTRQSRGINNEPVMLFDTWYLSAMNFPRCSISRTAALPETVQLWPQLLSTT